MDAQDKEDLRHKVLEILAERQPAGVTSAGVLRIASRELGMTLTETDVDAALELLRGLGFAIYNQDTMGTTKYWSATAAGVIKHERGEESAPPRRD